MSQTATDPLVGTTVAQYEILAKLGGGGMGIVYSARDTRLERHVALKFLPPQWSHDESAKQRFMLEARAASATNHRNICTIHDFGTADDGRLFIVMAQYDGPTLKQRLEHGPLAVDEAIDTAAQVAEGLARAHAQGVVHRDIKPGNLILAEDGVRILDFGLARLAGSQQLTLEGSTLGTVAYMSPEQSRGDDADARSDVWSIGIVLFEMLTGSLPFKGGYPEAISHAIRTNPMPSLRLPGGEPATGLERVVRRALEKDPGQRYQSARELARDLRLFQGRTVPVDLLTGPVPLANLSRSGPTRRRRAVRMGIAATVALVGVLAAAYIGLFVVPTTRVPIAVAPVVNQTGFADLDEYRLALTQELIGGLSGSDVVRVLPYERLLQVVRRFRAPGRDISSREALQAIGTESGAAVIIVPTLLYDNGAWHARVEFRNPSTTTNALPTFDGPRVVSSLVNETAYRQIPMLVDAVESSLRRSGGTRTFLKASLLAYSRREPPAAPRLASLDAATAFARALDSYEQQEYGQAATSIAEALQVDPRRPLLYAWQSRIAMMLRQDAVAAGSGQRAADLLTPDTREVDRRFITAVRDEASRDFDGAAAAYQDLTRRWPDDPSWVAELAAYQDRRTQYSDAISTYTEALAIDGRLIRPHLELCRLYNRRSETAKAREEGQTALTRYQQLGHEGGEALALFCLADSLRVGTADERHRSQEAAERGLAILERLNLAYNRPRGHYYVGLAAGEQGRLSEATRHWERAADEARTAGNTVLEPLLLMNLGVAHDRLGHGDRAVDFYAQASRAYQRLGDERRAAQAQANAAAVRTLYGEKTPEAIRELQNALAVSQRLTDSDFETFCLASLGFAYQFSGLYTQAQQELTRALALARQNDLKQKMAWITAGLAALRLELGDYTAARELATESVGLDAGRQQIRSRIILGRINTRTGDFAAAGQALRQAADALGETEDGLQPMLAHALGELAHEQNRPADARNFFARAGGDAADPLNEWSIESRAYLGLYDALRNNPSGRRALDASLGQAQQIGRFDLEQRIRTFIARAAVARREPASALAILQPMPMDDVARTMSQETRALALYWRGQARMLAGDSSGAAGDASTARSLIDHLRTTLSSQSQTALAARQDLRAILN